MKKLFSLVVLAGMFMLMSFNLDNQITQEENVIEDLCFSYASSVADDWMTATGGSYSDSVAIFNGAQASCIWNFSKAFSLTPF